MAKDSLGGLPFLALIGNSTDHIIGALIIRIGS